MAEMLLNLGKNGAPSYLKAQITRSRGQQQLSDLLDNLLDPQKPLENWDTLDWCRHLLAGGTTFNEFAKTVRVYDNATTCGLVWTANFVAYRCRTCGISPCMSLCSDCFQGGDHSGHDFNMFRSQAGGACDCGDISVMQAAGFCSRHGPERPVRFQQPPNELLIMAENIVPRLLLRFIQHLRDNCKPEAYLGAIQEAEGMLELLHDLCKMGGAMHGVLTTALTNPQLYKNLTDISNTSKKYKAEKGKRSYAEMNRECYLAALESMQIPKNIPRHLKDCTGLQAELEHKTLLEELVFWAVKYEFPQKMVTLLLNMLPFNDYKEPFTRAFVQHYSRISVALTDTEHPETLSNRVVHISVQLFSNENLATKVTDEMQLLHVMVISLLNMIEDILIPSTIGEPDQNFHMVVNCAHRTLVFNCYWPVVSDLINVLSHKQVAERFLKDQTLLKYWMVFLSYFAGMNLNIRELSQHVEFEPNTYYAAFSTELEACAAPMWQMASHCKTKETLPLSKSLLQVCKNHLQDWFDALNISDCPNPYQISYHLPLHRYFAVLFSQAVRKQDAKIHDFDLTEDFLQKLMVHPLAIQVANCEIHCGMWARNGLQIRGQAMTYAQSHFCNSMIDPDLFLLQLCGSQLDPDYFTSKIFERFCIMDWLTFAPKYKNSHLEADREIPMLEGALTLFAMLLNNRQLLGISDKEVLQAEIVTQLCARDRTHSQLIDLVPDKTGLTGPEKDFETILKQVSDYKEPVFEAGGMQQGMYTPKSEVWEKHYDPLHSILRAVHKRDIQSAMDRYTAFVKNANKFSGSGSPWPPFQPLKIIHREFTSLRRVLHCRTLHGILFTILYKALHNKSVPEPPIYMALNLLDMAVDCPSFPLRKKTEVLDRVLDKQFKDWFPMSYVLPNLSHTIKEVIVPKLLQPTRTSVENATANADQLLNSLLNDEVFVLLSPAGLLAGGAGIVTDAVTQGNINPQGTHTQGNATHQGSNLADYTSDDDSMDTSETETASHSTASSTATHAPPSMHTPAPTPAQYSDSGAIPKTSNNSFTSSGTSHLPNTEVVQVNESILSLLVKLHSRLCGKENSYKPPSKRSTDSKVTGMKVGDGPYYIKLFLDKVSRLSSEANKLLEEICHVNETTDDGDDSEQNSISERRRKARERQQKLLAQFASRQKKFMEQALESDVMDECGSSEEAKVKVTSKPTIEEYDCVICGQSSPSTEANPMGMVVLLQATSVLGHRSQNPESCHLPVSDGMTLYQGNLCSAVHDVRLSTLQKYFDDASCLQAVSIGWEGGVHTQTCGHYLHLHCHKSYLQSLRTEQIHMTQNLAVEKGEFTCPLCRQLSNAVLPCTRQSTAMSQAMVPVETDMETVSKQLASIMNTSQTIPTSSALTKAMSCVMEDITNATYPKFTNYCKTQCPENLFLFIYSVARTNLELELVKRGGNLVSTSRTPQKRSCIGSLLDVLGMHCRIVVKLPLLPRWSRLTQIYGNKDKKSLMTDKKEVPLLYHDVTSMLLQFVLSLPQPLPKEHYICIVKTLYSLLYIQSLAIISCRFPEGERIAWQENGNRLKTESHGMTLEGLMSHVITLLSPSWLYLDADMLPGIAICQSVWSPQSVENAIQEQCLPFLRIAALLQHFIFQDDLPPCQNVDLEFEVLVNYLGLVGKDLPTKGQTVYSLRCLQFVHSDPNTVIKVWCEELARFVKKLQQTGKNLLLYNPTFYAPRLLELPQNYDKIFQYYRKRQCHVCCQVPKDPAVCLVCGAMVCLKSECCRQQSILESVQHAINCGAGTALYLGVNSSTVIIVRGQRACAWGSLYLDSHGEEDRDLRRGKPLHLSRERFQVLEQLWKTLSIDHSCKRWMWHHNRL
ncbi:E3 ubiquitin-protein ligase UBR3-like [Ptychodera flava]|uniref:E3 ubiquitin-protein ligase UBR3-like n=1 Tax=Ptychodera flava TaxID=63121 RepID=UPI00396A12E3